MEDRLGAFVPGGRVRIAGAGDGPLAGTSFAAKDLIDVAGAVTGGGNPDWARTQRPAARHADVVGRLLAAGAGVEGKTVTDEISRGLFGENAHDGTPVNPAAPGRIPGGSSSGSASAVAGGLVDFALGTDTGGSVRIPASFCGLYGIRPTHGRVPLAGVMAQAPSYDTVGWMARDGDLLARVGAVLLDDAAAARRLRRLIVADDAFALADDDVQAALAPRVRSLERHFGTRDIVTLAADGLAGWARQQTVLQGREAWETFGDWIDRTNPRFSFEVAVNFLTGRNADDAMLAEAAAERDAVRARVHDLLGDDGVLCLPTTPFVAPPVGERVSTRNAQRARVLRLTCIAGTSGCPQVSLPLARAGGLPVGLSLIGPRGADEALLGLAALTRPAR